MAECVPLLARVLPRVGSVNRNSRGMLANGLATNADRNALDGMQEL
jgi:hypothetical protein